METLTKSVQKMKLLDFKATFGETKILKKWVRTKKGKKYLIKMYQVISKQRIFTKIDEEFAKYSGFKNRTELLTSIDQLHNSDNDLVTDPETGAVYLLRTKIYNLPKLN